VTQAILLGHGFQSKFGNDLCCDAVLLFLRILKLLGYRKVIGDFVSPLSMLGISRESTIWGYRWYHTRCFLLVGFAD